MRDDGVAQHHFRWQEDVRGQISRELRRLAIVVVPLGYIVAVTAAADSRPFVQSLGRPSFIYQPRAEQPPAGVPGPPGPADTEPGL